MIGEAPSLFYDFSSITERLDFGKVFSAPRPVELELGSGDGSFLVAWALRNPGRNFLAVERLLGRARKIDRKSRRAGLDNVRVLRLEASYTLEFMIPSASLEAIHVYFPDPWPKRRHWKNRLVNERFPALCARVLKPGGLVFLRTDNPPYFDQMLEVFGAARDFKATETPAGLAEVVTDFERGFVAQGIGTRRAAYSYVDDRPAGAA